LVTKLEEARNYMIRKIDIEKYVVNDKTTANDLKKMVMKEMKLKAGTWGHVDKILREILKTRNIAIENSNPSSQIGDVTFNLTKPDLQTPIKATITKPEAKPISAPQPPPVPPATPIIKPTLDPTVEKANQETIKEGFKFVGQIYSAFGIIKGTSKYNITEMTAEQFETECDKYAERVGSFCYRHNIEIPFLIEVFSLIATGVLIFVVPLIKTFFLKTEKEEYDKTLTHNIENEVKAP